jgi:hypothetical protein
VRQSGIQNIEFNKVVAVWPQWGKDSEDDWGGEGRVEGDRSGLYLFGPGELSSLSNRSEELGIARPRGELQSRSRSPIVLVLGVFTGKSDL